MPKVLYSSASPYSAKVRMAVAYAGIVLDVRVNIGVYPPCLIGANPLGKIPVLAGDDGEAVYDSRAITQHLNRLSGSQLFPRSPGQADGRRANRGAGRRHPPTRRWRTFTSAGRGRRKWFTSPGWTSSGARFCGRSTI